MFQIWVVELGCGCFFWQKYLIPKSFQNFSFINLELSWIREKIAHHIDQSIFEKKKKIFFIESEYVLESLYRNDEFES